MAHARPLALLSAGLIALVAGAFALSEPAAAGPSARTARTAGPARRLPTRTATAPPPAPAPPPAVDHVALVVHTGARVPTHHSARVFSRFPVAEAWPLPDELPLASLAADPAVLALQELLAADGEAERAAALDALAETLDTAPPADDAWARLARLEAERQLEAAAQEAELAAHTAALLAWEGTGGPLPAAPAPRDTAPLAEAAADLAEDLPPGPAAELAALTAAALYTDWEGSSFDEDAAAALALDVLHTTEDRHLLAAASALLVGTTVPLDPGELALLAELAPELPTDERGRMASFLADRHAARGDDAAALAALDQALQADAERGATDAAALHDRRLLRESRAQLLGRTGGVARDWDEAVFAGAQRCADTTAPASQRLQLRLDPSGAQLESAPTPFGRCLVAALGAVPGLAGPLVLDLELAVDDEPI